MEVQGIVKLGEVFQNPADALLNPQTKFWQDGQETPCLLYTSRCV